MKICVLYPKACYESAKELADALGADLSNPYEENRRNYLGYDVVFNYGCQRKIHTNKVINNYQAVGVCIDKVKTFDVLKAEKLYHPAYAVKQRDVPKDWDIVVCRETAKGAKNVGMEYCYQFKGEQVPVSALYTEWFDLEHEYRIVVFNGRVVGRYHKTPKKGADIWEFTLMRKQGFEQVDKECLAAAKALDIDYVGFDVIENKEGQFVILEANSGPILTDEVKKEIVKYFK